MEEAKRREFLDDDILKALQEISHLKERFITCCDEKQKLKKVLRERTNEIAKAREIEKSHNNALAESRKLITDQQITISKLMSIKDEIKRYKEEIAKREKRIDDVEKEKYDIIESHVKQINDIKDQFNKQTEILNLNVQELTNEINITKSELVCNTRKHDEVILRLKEEKDEQINHLVLEYEEKLQRAYAKYIRIKDEMRVVVERTNITNAAYREKIEALEQKQVQRINVVAPNGSRSATSSNCQVSTKTGYRNVDESRLNQNQQQYGISSNTARCETPSPQVNSAHMPDSSYANKNKQFKQNAPSNTPRSACASGSNHGPFMIASTGNNYQRTPFKPAQVIRNSASSTKINDGAQTEAVKKPVKRKLFSKYNDNFIEEE